MQKPRIKCKRVVEYSCLVYVLATCERNIFSSLWLDEKKNIYHCRSCSLSMWIWINIFFNGQESCPVDEKLFCVLTSKSLKPYCQ